MDLTIASFDAISEVNMVRDNFIKINTTIEITFFKFQIKFNKFVIKKNMTIKEITIGFILLNEVKKFLSIKWLKNVVENQEIFVKNASKLLGW